MWKTRSKLLFTAGALISGFALMQMGMYAGQHVFGWKLNFNVFQICRSLLQHYGIGYMVDALSGLVFVPSVSPEEKQSDSAWLPGQLSADCIECATCR